MKKTKTGKLQEVELTLQEWKAATRPNIHRNKKKYYRKTKHKNQYGY